MASKSNPPPVGVDAALANTSGTPMRTALSLFSLHDRVALVTGAHRGIGLELALALAEAGAAVYCLDLPPQPDDEWLTVQRYASQLPPLESGHRNGRLEYVSGDVTDQKGMWAAVESIVQTEGRIDICVANAGIHGEADCLEYPDDEFKKIMDVNVNGVLYTAQAAGRQMERLGIAGSIIMTASISGSVSNQGHHWMAYNTSKSAVIQMARSMACELGPTGIRVNSLSPGYVYTKLSKAYVAVFPEVEAKWASQNPMGRVARADELRGVILWLAGDGSTFCTGSDIIVDGGHRAW